MDNEHLVVTPPDRYWAEGIKILLVDWPADLIETTINMIEGSPNQLIIHLFDSNKDDPQWLLDVSNQVSFIIMNMGAGFTGDVFKGTLITRSNVHYYGREGLEKYFPNYVKDPQGRLLVLIGEYINKMEKNNV